jgi:hypothetical protein
VAEGYVVSKGDRGDPRELAQRSGHLGEGLFCFQGVSLRELYGARSDEVLHHEQMLRLKAERLVQKEMDAADHPAGAGEQHRGEGELGDDQQTSEQV